MQLQPFFIGGSDAGLRQDVKPFILPDKAYQTLENAVVFRQRVIKRLGNELLGRLQRILAGVSLGNSTAGTWPFIIYNFLTPPGKPETNATIAPGSVIITLGGITFTDNGNGTLSSITPGNSGTINYVTWSVTLTHTAGVVAASINFNYYPGLPVMGILLRYPSTSIADEDDYIFFDTKYTYKFVAGAFQDLPGVTWAGSDSDFFYSTNYQGADSSIKTFFVTNFVNDANDPMRYTQNGSTFTTFAPRVSTGPDIFLTSALILIPYYGRLIALNTWESQAGYANAKNFFARARWSQVGNPLDTDAWRSDILGRGGFIDAPTNEQIQSAVFFKNTLIVHFENSTWQLRYQGEYGIPFIWERVSSDYGCDATFSSIIFDQGVRTIGDKAITISTGVNTIRMDNQIPDFVFEIEREAFGKERTYGIRDFQKEFVYWSFVDSQFGDATQVYPNNVLLYNYQNDTYSIFRDNVTCFGQFQTANAITWDSTTVLWDNQNVTWDDPLENAQFPFIASGNQNGYIHLYQYTTPDDVSMPITAINFAQVPLQLTMPNHNLVTGEIIFINGAQFSPNVDPGLNNNLFQVTFIDVNTVSLAQWDFTAITPGYQSVDFSTSPPTYVGGGSAALFPRLNLQTKDFNFYQDQGKLANLSYIDFLTAVTNQAQMTVNLFVNSSPQVQGNLIIGNQESPTYATTPYNTPGGLYNWQRFYAQTFGQYFNVQITYDDPLMNTLNTHIETWELNAINFHARIGGNIVF